jgi:hypothetical protein
MYKNIKRKQLAIDEKENYFNELYEKGEGGDKSEDD